MKPINSATIHTLPDCPWCEKAKLLLEYKGFEITEVHGKSDLWPTVPYIEINGTQIGGFVELSRAVRTM